MLNEQVVLELYQNQDAIKSAKSFDEYKNMIMHGLEIATKSESCNTPFDFSDADRKHYNLALKYNEEVIFSLLKES